MTAVIFLLVEQDVVVHALQEEGGEENDEEELSESKGLVFRSMSGFPQTLQNKVP